MHIVLDLFDNGLLYHLHHSLGVVVNEGDDRHVLCVPRAVQLVGVLLLQRAIGGYGYFLAPTSVYGVAQHVVVNIAGVVRAIGHALVGSDVAFYQPHLQLAANVCMSQHVYVDAHCAGGCVVGVAFHTQRYGGLFL